MIQIGYKLTSQFLVVLVFQVLLVFFTLQTSNFVSAGRKPKNSQITLPMLYKELRRESDEFLSYHLLSMLTIIGNGHRLYNMTEDSSPSAECLATAEASMTMARQLSIGKEADDVQSDVVDAAVEDVRQHIKLGLLKHPLEFVCERLEKAYAEKANLGPVFDRLKKAAAKGSFGDRPAYAQKLYTVAAQLAIFMFKKLNEPVIAKSMASEQFLDQTNETEAFSSRHYLFAVSVVAIARKEAFAEKLQSLYEKALDDIVKEIVVEEFRLSELLLEDEKTFWFLPKFVKIFYRYIAADEALKKELDSTAAIYGKDVDKSDLDFSKF